MDMIIGILHELDIGSRKGGLSKANDAGHRELAYASQNTDIQLNLIGQHQYRTLATCDTHRSYDSTHSAMLQLLGCLSKYAAYAMTLGQFVMSINETKLRIIIELYENTRTWNSK